MRFMIDSTSSPNEHTRTDVDMIETTNCSRSSLWSSLKCFTMSRSDTIPSM